MQPSPFIRKPFLLSALCALSMMALPACQKAKMKTVPKPVHEEDDSHPAAFPPRTLPPNNGPNINPVNSGGTVGFPMPDKPERKKRKRYQETDPGPSYVVYPKPPIVTDSSYFETEELQYPVQPPVNIRGKTNIVWIDSHLRPPNVLPICGSSCLPGDGVTPIPPHCPQDCPIVDVIEEPKPEPPKEYQCDSIIQRPAPLTDKLDVLIVMDTSASLYAEYKKIAANISSFVKALPEETDFRFAVMIGHGPEAQVDGQNWFGRFWTTPETSNGPDLPVINAGKIKHKGESDREGLNVRDLSGWLALKFKGGEDRSKIPHDSTKVQGEALLANLYEFMSNDEKFNAYSEEQVPQRDVFPRKNAALAVIFIADENDVCYDYATTNRLREEQGRPLAFPNFANKAKGKTDEDGITRDEPEHISYHSSVCKVNGENLNYEKVAEALLSRYPRNAEGSKNMPLIVSGILYRTNSEIPSYSDKYAGDNEAGWGYLDLIESMAGESVSLGDENFGEDLAQIGDLSKFKLQYENVIPIQHNGKRIDLRKVDLNSLRVEIEKPDGERIAIDPADTTLEVTERDPKTGEPLAGNLVIARGVLQEIIGPNDRVLVFYRAR